MDNWLMDSLRGETFGFMVLVASFLFGLSSAATTAACGGLPAMLVILGYTGSNKTNSRRQLLIAATAFALSSIVVLGAIGALAGFIGSKASDVMATTTQLGFIFQKILGFAAIFIGLSALDLLPLRLPNFKISTEKVPSGALGAIFLGATVGLATAGCAAACSPLQLPIVINLAALRGRVLEGTVILIIFAIGFVSPLVAVMLGVGMTKANQIMEKLDKPLRLVSGVILILVGLWLCSMFTKTLTGW